MSDEASRRRFLTDSLVAGAAGLAAASVSPALSPANEKDAGTIAAGAAKPRSLTFQPRYHRWHVDPGVEWTETNTQYATLHWTVPISQTAIVLVDVWDHHYLRDTEARTEVVISEKLLPLLAACRSTGMPIIHAPSAPQAMQHPNWRKRSDGHSTTTVRQDWPPTEFLNKRGPYQAFARPREPREAELVKLRAERQLHPLVQPLEGEAVVATGDELHHYCREQEILFLFYVGFNTNACVLVNDYGTLAMSQRGYEVIIVRDCTTGMESAETQPALSQTSGAILFLEMFGRYSTTSEEIVRGLSAS